MRFAFVKVHQDPLSRVGAWRPKFTVSELAPHGMHWSRFGVNIKGWDLVWTNIPISNFTADSADYHLLDNVTRLNMAVGEIPQAKRAAMKTWLENNGYDTGWIKNATIIKAVLKDILYWLNSEQGDPDNLIRWCSEYMSDD